jgi:hypothetical protein
MSMKNSSDTIDTRDLPACSTVPQPTAPPRTPWFPGVNKKNVLAQSPHSLQPRLFIFPWKSELPTLFVPNLGTTATKNV